MIQNSFIFLPKISIKKEQSIWKQGVTNWNKFLSTNKIKGISDKNKLIYNELIKQAKQSLLEEDLSFFIKHLKQKHMFRLYSYFKDSLLFLDIEPFSKRDILLVGLFDGYETKTLIKNINIDKNNLEKEINKYKLLITFNGLTYDIPMLKKVLKLEIKIPHIDLKQLCINLNYKGGLKEIENILNLKRPIHLKGSPFDAYKAFLASQDQEYLDLIIQYNQEDIINLKPIAEFVIKETWNKIYHY